MEYRRLTLEDFDDRQFILGLQKVAPILNGHDFETFHQVFTEKRPATVTYIAVDTDLHLIVGYASVGTFQSFAGAKFGTLYDVAVHPEFQGRGYGTALVTFAFADWQGKGLTYINGPVSPERIDFYTGTGAVEQPGVTLYTVGFSNRPPRLQPSYNPAVRFRELELTDFDGHWFDDIDPDVLGTTDVEQLRTIFTNRVSTVTHVALDQSTNKIIGHAACHLHHSFTNQKRAALFDFKMSEQFRGSELETEFGTWVRDYGRAVNITWWLNCVATPADAALCARIGMSVVPDTILMYFPYDS